MEKIVSHPILDIPTEELVSFQYEGKTLQGRKEHSIAAALHQSGFPVHSESLCHRHRSLECGIGKCGACEMLVDGEVRRVCMTPVEGVKTVSRIPTDFVPQAHKLEREANANVYKTRVAIVGAGPAGLATREKLLAQKIDCIVIDANPEIGGQFLMQTHKFFFFEQEHRYGGLRGFEIARTLAGNCHSGIFLNCTVWDILEGNRLAVKNGRTNEIFYVDADYFVVAAGAVPFMPTFENDDLPGVYTAAVVQKMMNTDLTLLGKRVLTVGAGNIGYLTSYQLMQAGAKVAAIIEAQGREGGFPVQANRLRRLGVPILTSHILLKAIPNRAGDGISGAVVARCENFKPIPGTEQIIEDIDAINICTGLVPDDALFIKGREMFGRRCFGAGDAVRIGEGTSAVLRGQQVAYEIMEDLRMGKYDDFLRVSKEYIDSQQHPVRVLDTPFMPTPERMEKPFVVLDCVYGFACNPCQFSCKFGAITKLSSNDVPKIDYNKCVGCMQCVALCPGLAIFGYNVKNSQVFLPVEFSLTEGDTVYLVDNNGQKVCEGVLEKVIPNKSKTHIARVKANAVSTEDLLRIRGIIEKQNFPEPLRVTPAPKADGKIYVCHCEDVGLDDVLKVVGERTSVTVDELKHTTHLGMGPCRGKRCFLRVRQILRARGVTIVGDAAPRAPLSAQVLLADLYPTGTRENIVVSNKKTEHVGAFIAGGGIVGSALFRYMAEAGMKPVMVNKEHGSSWRNIAAGRPAFSLPELSEIARENRALFQDLEKKFGIEYSDIHYISFAHDESMYASLEKSMAWQKARMLKPSEFKSEISPYFNNSSTKYLAALKSDECWQASPGKTVNAIRALGEAKGGRAFDTREVISVHKNGNEYIVLVKNGQEYVEYITPVFVNAMGANGEKFARMLGIDTGHFAVKHQAFITRRLPMLGVNGGALDMLIDRQKYKGFSAVYGQQLHTTGQIIGCASPTNEPNETKQDLRINDKEFLNIISEVFVDWIPELAGVGLQAAWAGYYIEPKYVVDVEHGLFLGMKGHGFMLGQHIAKLYVDKLLGRSVPGYFERMKLGGDGLLEGVFK
jgi:glycine/D-amino acid oxidase-like deaminating enzyme/Fe-S-cluster-containing hydrogenase component 2